MTHLRSLRTTAAALSLLAAVPLARPAGAQQPDAPEDASRTAGDSIGTGSRIAIPAIRIQHLRPRDQRGIGVFEPPKHDTVSYRGFRLQLGAAFTQEFQGLRHTNTAQPRIVNGVNQNQLVPIGNGFNNAVANLYVDAQVARHIRVELTTYLSARHHQETWVKDGYFLIDGSPFENDLIDRIFEDVTLKVGHFEVNYGDQHFRRTDNGEAMYNPLVGNYILDAFTTEIGAEAYWRRRGILLMGGLTGGEVHGQVTTPEKRSAAYLAKVGWDGWLGGGERRARRDWRDREDRRGRRARRPWRDARPERDERDARGAREAPAARGVRLRLTASTYGASQSASNTLYTGDRAGSPFYSVIEPIGSSETTNAWSGQIRPGFANAVHAYVVNPFVKFRGLELFGNVETATGKAAAEARKRTIRQLAGEAAYRFAPRDQFYVAGRWNRVAGTLAGIPNDIEVNRWEAGAGWFVTPLVLAKATVLQQKYLDFPATDIRSGGKFNGFMITGTVAF